MALLQLQGFVAPLLALLPDDARAGGREGKNVSVDQQNITGGRPAKKHVSLPAEQSWQQTREKHISLPAEQSWRQTSKKHISLLAEHNWGQAWEKTHQFTGRTQLQADQ